jgi:site-specific recombinase XerD
VQLHAITPAMVGDYLDQLDIGPATKKLHLAGLRKFFDRLVLRHVIILNPAASVRGPRQSTVEGKTPEITPEQARLLVRSMDTSHVVGLRDRAAIGIMIYTAARVGAVARLRIKDFRHDGSHWTLRFREKGGKHREIPVRADLEAFLLEYMDAAGLREAAPASPLFRSAIRRTRQLSARAMSAIDLGQMVKRRLADVGLPGHLSPHSFRVATITDLLRHGATLEDVQHLAGHADPRTTRLYDRRQRRITRNIVERITI